MRTDHLHDTLVTAAMKSRAEILEDAPYAVVVATSAWLMTLVSPAPDVAYALAVVEAVCPMTPSLAVSLTAEAFTRRREDNEEHPDRGALAALAGIDPRVRPCLTVATAWRAGRSAMSIRPYEGTDGGIRWLEGSDGDLDPAGLAGEALISAISVPVDERVLLLGERACLDVVERHARGWGFAVRMTRW